MHTIFTTYLIDEECPKNKNEKNCALREYLKKSDLFHFTQNETLLKPTKELYRLARAEYMHAFEEIHQICRKCQMENAQRVK